MYDVYTSGLYEFALSTDLKTFTKDTKPVSFNFTPRHGTIIPITRAEKNSLLAKWDPTGIVSQRLETIEFFSHNFSGNSLNLTSGKFTSNTSVALVDLSGRTVLRQAVSGTSIKIDLSTIPAGVYHVLYKTDTGKTGCMRIAVK